MKKTIILDEELEGFLAPDELSTPNNGVGDGDGVLWVKKPFGNIPSTIDTTESFEMALLAKGEPLSLAQVNDFQKKYPNCKIHLFYSNPQFVSAGLVALADHVHTTQTLIGHNITQTQALITKLTLIDHQKIIGLWGGLWLLFPQEPTPIEEIITGDFPRAIGCTAVTLIPAIGAESELIECTETFETTLAIPLATVNQKTSIKFQFKRADGTRPYLDFLRMVADRIQDHLVIAQLIEQVSSTKRALIQAEKLSVAGRVTASIAHEIKNPLQGVQNCLHLLGMPGLSAEQHQRYLDMTNQEMDRLANTVQQMLEFYKPNQEFKPVQVLDVLEHTLDLVNSQLSENGIKVRTVWPPKIPNVLAIRNQIEQVLLNLVLNAKDAMPNGGSLSIKIEITKPFLSIIVADSGSGIPLELRDQVFEHFFSTKGTSGLGLPVSREIIKNHHGILELVDRGSEPGACFKIILPIKQEGASK